jgi:hypothetical protein
MSPQGHAAPSSLVRSSAAEYLTFVAANGKGGVEAVYADENVWLSQKMMAQLYDVEVPTINYHLKKVFEDSELDETSVIRNFRITAADGKTYETRHYNLSATIAVGYKVNSERAVQFRKWATRVVEEFTIKGFAMDDERLKRGGSVLSDRYFEEQLQRGRNQVGIRMTLSNTRWLDVSCSEASRWASLAMVLRLPLPAECSIR